MKRTLYLIILFFLILTIISPVNEADDINYISKQELIESLDLNSDIKIIEKNFIDITGDQIKEQIFLIGQKPAGPNSLFYAPIEVIVYNIYKKEFYTATYESFGGYEPEISFYDFNGDKIKDIFVRANSGGSGGIYHHLIASYIDQKLKIIFDQDNNKGLRIDGKYEDDFKASFIIRELEQRFKLDLTFNKDRYIREGIYREDGTLLREVKPYTYPYGKLTPVNYDFDETFELKGYQQITGAYGADSIGHLETLLKYENSWQVKQIEISTFLKKYNPGQPTNSSQTNYEIKRNALKSGIKEIYYPQINNLPADVNDVYINKKLRDMVKPFFNEDNELKVDYEFTYKSNKLISVKYSGYQKHEAGQYEILKSFNYDLKDNRVINTDNILKDGNTTERNVNQIIKENITDKELKNTFPGLANWMGIYITSNELVIYYLRNDFETEFKKINIPLQEIESYLSINPEIKKEETEIFFIEVD